jgi:hypothetical protein
LRLGRKIESFGMTKPVPESVISKAIKKPIIQLFIVNLDKMAPCDITLVG